MAFSLKSTAPNCQSKFVCYSNTKKRNCVFTMQRNMRFKCYFSASRFDPALCWSEISIGILRRLVSVFYHLITVRPVFNWRNCFSTSSYGKFRLGTYKVLRNTFSGQINPLISLVDQLNGWSLFGYFCVKVLASFDDVQFPAVTDGSMHGTRYCTA